MDTIALTYRRVSTYKQERDGVSLDVQTNQCIDYIRRQTGMRLGGDFSDTLTGRTAKVADSSDYADKSDKTKTDSSGRFKGTMTTVKGWRYTEFSGMHTGGPTEPPEPPVLSEVIVYVREKDGKWLGYQLAVPAPAQSEAFSGVRRLHLPDLPIHDAPTTKPAAAP